MLIPGLFAFIIRIERVVFNPDAGTTLIPLLLLYIQGELQFEGGILYRKLFLIFQVWNSPLVNMVLWEGV